MEQANVYQRTGSLYESDPQELLLKAFEKRNLDRFVKVLDGKGLNIDHYYGDPDHGSIIDLCARQENTSQFLRAVLDHGANPNVINRMRKKAPLHFIVEKNDIKNLSTFLEFPNVDINIVDNFGDTPLHYAAKGQKKVVASDTKALQRLLEEKSINVNIANRKSLTPAHLAAVHSNKDALLLLIRKDDIDLNSSKDKDNKSALDLIKEKYEDIYSFIMCGPEKPLPGYPQTVRPDYVFSLLRAKNTELFMKALKENSDLKNEHDGQFTLLQYACDNGLLEEATFLIGLGADVNKTNQNLDDTPIMLASRKGYYRVVKELIKADVDISFQSRSMETVFHCVVNGSEDSYCSEERDHLKCLDVLLNCPSKGELINRGDFKGYTPLHLAGKMENDEMVIMLLEAGAYVGCVNVYGDPALSYISPSIFERYLDKCVRTNEKRPREENYEIIINYKCFVPTSNESLPVKDHFQNNQVASSGNFNETDLLLYTSKSPDLKHLLMHPVLKSLIYMKWFNIRKWFYVNLMFYLLFWAFFSAYILAVYDLDSSTNNDNSNKTNTDIDSHSSKETKGFMWFIVTILLFLFLIRELFQLKKSYRQYLVNPENWLEMGLIVISVIILFVNVRDDTKNQLAASAILFSWTELVLLIGKHPALSTHIEMLKTVGWNFLEFLAWYSILIVAFALSFYTLFRDDHHSEDEVFGDPGVSMFKTVVMLTGEFEAGEIPFHRYPYTGHLLFVLFVFAIAMVMYNLLNGLAVSDTQAIKSDAEMVSYISRIKLVSYIETLDLLSCKNLFSGFKKCKLPRDDWTNDSLSCNKPVLSLMIDHKIHIFPNDGNKISFASTQAKRKRIDVEDPIRCCLFDSCNCKQTVMDSTIVKSAQTLLNKKQGGSERHVEFGDNTKLLDELKRVLEEQRNVLKQMNETEKRIRSLTESFKLDDRIAVTSLQNDY